MTSRAIVIAFVVAALLGGAAACALLLPARSGADQSLQQLRSRAAGQRAREQSLSAAVARLDGLVSRLERQLTVLRARRAEQEAELAAGQARLARLQADLRAQRRHLARLRARLAYSRAVLARRLVAIYKASDVDVVTVILSSHGFADMLERASFMRRVQHQDEEIIDAVRSARRDTANAVAQLAVTETRQQRFVAGVKARRDALVSMASAAAERQQTLTRVRAARAAALNATRADRRRVEQRISALEAAQVRAALQAPRGSGPWAIPWPIVQCESGGQNLPPNSAGASGYYQILPETWRRSGGSGPQAYLAPKSEQDRVAATIWAHDGPGAWVCSALVQ